MRNALPTKTQPVFIDKTIIYINIVMHTVLHNMGTAVAQWSRCCATNRKVAGSIPAGASGFFIDIKSF